ncbi:hypothetical protein [Mesorhizobium sangaii]|uniref:DUF91 domain-containing protein n=1 Tax=Mesorhizobium sangaii TaxID=505389 RepID=A0A841PDP3_9HYPH|nr:hypothetical protein [Mesorhizobium sangaii]MBB6411871.1 hypothetical protein [Mesorhizobium sangaii]
MRSREASGYDERFVQELVHHCPTVLPVAEVEPVFTPLAAVCMELPLASGYLDNLLVTPRGDLVAVECKLWRNVEARREVIAQIIDYAKDLQLLTYEDLQTAIRKARNEPSFSLYAHANSGDEETESALDEPRFIDAVSRNLRRGRCLLVILGDGITENVEGLTEFLQQHAGLHFALVLVQLSIHDLPGTDQRIVVPSIPLRTTNIVRGIVQIDDGRVSIVPPAPTTRSEKPTTLSEDEIFAALDARVPGTSDRLVAFLAGCEDLQVRWEVKKTIIVRMTVGEFRVLVFVINANGTVDMGYTYGIKDLTRGFVQKVVNAVPATVFRETPKTAYAKKTDGTFLTVWELLDNASGIRAALEELNRTLLAADAKSAE